MNARRKSESYSARENGSVALTAAGDGLAVLGRQAVASAIKVAVRAVIGSWKGVTTVTLKAFRTLQVRACWGGR